MRKKPSHNFNVVGSANLLCLVWLVNHSFLINVQHQEKRRGFIMKFILEFTFFCFNSLVILREKYQKLGMSQSFLYERLKLYLLKHRERKSYIGKLWLLLILLLLLLWLQRFLLLPFTSSKLQLQNFFQSKQQHGR